MPKSDQPPGIDPRLQDRLHAVAARVRAQPLHTRSTITWILVSALGLGWVAVCWRFPALRDSAFPVLGIATLVVGWIVARWWRRTPYDYERAAALIEQDHPDLQEVLRTALEQRPGPDGTMHFLQRRVVNAALKHADSHPWDDTRRRIKPWRAVLHTAALALVAVMLGVAIQPPAAMVAVLTPPEIRVGEVVVTPGNTEVEKGSAVLIAARFGGELPTSATLVWTPTGGSAQRAPMTRSLADPVFAVTLPRVEADVDYHVEYETAASDAFRVQVFERPGLVRADATLDYPDYTGLVDRKIEDTRRLTAVEGTKVDYDFLFNKPVRSAVLRTAEGVEVPLTAANPERTRYALNFTVAESVRYALHLEDDDARTNPAPADIRIEALVNRRPDLKLTFPRGDQRVSALEEIRLEGEARDDFGLIDYGIAIAVGENPAEFVSLREADTKAAQARFQRLLTLESEGVAPDDLVTWFAWADDVAADGSTRRTEGDPYFGEVRPFDEIFREQREGGGGGGGSGEGAEILELQRQITVGIWKKRQQTPGPLFHEDMQMLDESQATARTLLSELAETLRDPTMMGAATKAGRHMDETRKHLQAARAAGTTEALQAAGQHSHLAYSALLPLQPRETNVSQSRNNQGGGGGRNQRQLNQLKFRDNEDNYEDQSQAEEMTSPEQREKLETLARLKELARRQSDVNERLQQLQTALQEASSEEERERIRRELKRLEEEQRQMLSDLDDVRQRVERQPQSAGSEDSRQQLEETRESMREAGESLERGDVSQALAEGTRARDDLEQVSDDLRKESSSQFAEQLREARQAARDLARGQQESQQAIDNLDTNGPRALDSSDERSGIANQIEEHQASHEQLLEQLRQITEDSEISEPGLHRQLYDLLRDHGQRGTDSRMEAGADALRQGFVEQSRELQPEITRDLEELRQGVERAAESVLGDETNTLRFAQRELDQLSRELERERPEGAGAGGDQPQYFDGGQRDDQGQGDARSRAESGQGQGREPGERGERGNAPGENGDQPGVGESGIAQGPQPGERPGPGEQPGDQPGTGGRGREPGTQPGAGDQPGVGEQPAPGTGESGELAENGSGESPGEREGQGEGQGQRPGEGRGEGREQAQRGEGRGPGEQPGEGEQGQGQGTREGQGEGQGPGEGERPSFAQGGSQPGQQPGQSGEQGQGRGPGRERGEGQGQGQGEGERAGNAAGQGPGESSEPGENQSLADNRSGQPGGGPGGGSSRGQPGGEGEPQDELARALEELYGGEGGGEMNTGGAGGGGGPITGGDFSSWEERLRTVEALLDSPEARARLAQARERAQQARADFRRHANKPQWNTLESGIAAPLDEVRTWLRQELARREDPTALQPVDRDPVPERFEENVKKYYEALGE